MYLNTISQTKNIYYYIVGLLVNRNNARNLWNLCLLLILVLFDSNLNISFFLIIYCMLIDCRWNSNETKNITFLSLRLNRKKFQVTGETSKIIKINIWLTSIDESKMCALLKHTQMECHCLLAMFGFVTFIFNELLKELTNDFTFHT